MSSDFNTNKRRVDITFGWSNGPGVHKTWDQVIKAVLSGERFIRTSLITLGKYEDKYDKDGNCITVGVYNNKLCKALKKHGITDIRYGSTCNSHLWPFFKNSTRTPDNMYTIYKPKGGRNNG